MNLITTTSSTMITTDLLGLVNTARSEFGENTVRHNDFVARCRDELDGEYYEKTVVRPTGPGRPFEALILTRDQCKLVAMRESKGVRRRVLALINEIESRERIPTTSLPGNYIQALEHLLDSKRQEQAAIEQRDHAVATKAEIGSRREATAMATASAAVRQVQKLKEELGLGTRQASVVAVEKETGRKFGVSGYVPLRRWCKDRGITAPKVIHPTFGSVRAWPAGAWMDVYQIDLTGLFGIDGDSHE